MRPACLPRPLADVRLPRGGDFCGFYFLFSGTNFEAAPPPFLGKQKAGISSSLCKNIYSSTTFWLNRIKMLAACALVVVPAGSKALSSWPLIKGEISKRMFYTRTRKCLSKRLPSNLSNSRSTLAIKESSNLPQRFFHDIRNIANGFLYCRFGKFIGRSVSVLTVCMAAIHS